MASTVFKDDDDILETEEEDDDSSYFDVPGISSSDASLWGDECKEE